MHPKQGNSRKILQIIARNRAKISLDFFVLPQFTELLLIKFLQLKKKLQNLEFYHLIKALKNGKILFTSIF